MEEEVSRAFYMGFSALLFVIAVTLLICYRQKLNDVYDTLYQQAASEYVLTETGNDDGKDSE
jgi:hypothetical protein